jgi:hypothetical protein
MFMHHSAVIPLPFVLELQLTVLPLDYAHLGLTLEQLLVLVL